MVREQASQYPTTSSLWHLRQWLQYVQQELDVVQALSNVFGYKKPLSGVEVPVQCIRCIAEVPKPESTDGVGTKGMLRA